MKLKLCIYLLFLSCVMILVPFVYFSPTYARSTGPKAICEAWLNTDKCDTYYDCKVCHSSQPTRNLFGQAIEKELWPGDLTPNDDQDFLEQVTALLPQLAEIDSDGDGFDNRSEVQDGTDPGDPDRYPQETILGPCENLGDNPSFDVCNYDIRFAYKRVSQDFCGIPVSWQDYKNFLAQNFDRQVELLHEKLDECLQSNFWIGKDGVLWSLAHKKIRPLQAIKSGDGMGNTPLGDYDDDYALFIYIMTGDRDARDLLQAQYFVNRIDGNPTRYQRVDSLERQNVPTTRRSGMITTTWFHVINTMFTPMPRTTAAQAYRSYLGYDIAKSEGLIEPSQNESGVLIDYDKKGITVTGCAACHRTLDRLSYPFTRYEGIVLGGGNGGYNPSRLDSFVEAGEDILLADTPEEGFIFGVKVSNLQQWAQVAVDSDEFAKKIVLDLWNILIASKLESQQYQEAFDELWQGFMNEKQDNYRVKSLLHRLIDLEVYGGP